VPTLPCRINEYLSVSARKRLTKIRWQVVHAISGIMKPKMISTRRIRLALGALQPVSESMLAARC
jgi:hypothetical protein